ncbi:hypothetical protein HMI56_006046 [Coelomomyces lativittatus]|nr:hypothetical protein HMI56_006046 [Coelomomyces lativittatus]
MILSQFDYYFFLFNFCLVFIKNFAEEIERLGLKPQVTPTTYSTTPENEPLFPYLPKKEDRFSRSHHWSRLSHARSFREKNRSIQSEEIPSQHSTLHTSSSSLSLKRANDFLGKIRGPSETKGTPS